MPTMARPNRAPRTPRRHTRPSRARAVDRPLARLSDQVEVGDTGQPSDDAVDAERGEGAGLKVSGYGLHRDIRADAGQHAADHDLAVDAVAERAHQVRDLQRSGSEDDRGGEQEREP